jgi:anaerobic magnesium-protoporphyrin IX monomethyl ester cyclase
MTNLLSVSRSPSLLVNLPLVKVSTTPFFVMPPSLLSLAAYLRQNGEPASVLDLCVSRPHERNPADSDAVALQRFEKRLLAERPALVGVSVMAAGQFKLARELCRRAKEHFPSCITVVGGAHVSQFPREILEHCPEVDFVVIGEGEPQLLALARFARTSANPHSWPDGLAQRGSGGEIEVSPKRSYVKDVDALPWPAYDLVCFDDYRHDTSTWHNPYHIDLGVRVPVITSRGCPYGCNFCSVAASMGLRHRPRSAARVADELQMLHEKHGVRYFAFFDANFAQDPLRVIALCNEILKRNLRLTLDLPTGLPFNAATPEMVDALAAAGLIRTCVSVESGDAHIRNEVMGKNIEEDDMFAVVAAVRRHPQIFLVTDYVLGMPEDTEESLEASCELIERLDTDDIALCLATPYPGTRLYEQCVRDDLFLPGIDRSRLWEADWYCHNNLNRFVIKPYQLNLETLTAYRDRILAFRASKRRSYRNRMQDRFEVEVRQA